MPADWTLRPIEREQVGTHLVFATRSCCGPDGEGACRSAAEGLPCGVVEVPRYAALRPNVAQRAESLRALRIRLGLSLRVTAAALGLSAVELGELERGIATVDNWPALRSAVRALDPEPTDAR